jgi:hypothetical protein
VAASATATNGRVMRPAAGRSGTDTRWARFERDVAVRRVNDPPRPS